VTRLQAAFAALSAVVLFVHGLQGFSLELRAVGGVALQNWLARVTRRGWAGFAVGALTTAVVQSSSAVTSLAASLVDAGVFSFRASLAVLLGANVGTTATAWLVSFKLTGMGPVFIVLGTVLSLLPARISVAGKAVFYFGLIFLALDLISAGLEPWKQDPVFIEWLALAHSPWLGVLAGLVITMVVQSCSVTTGLAIVLVQQGALPAEAAIPIVVGANVGSTSTALMASLTMSAAARATAQANALFNLMMMLVCLPFLPQLSRWVVGWAGDPGMAVAWAHLLFNLCMALALLAGMKRLAPWLQRVLKVPERQTN
jgi:phosphate:Na+ symporter